MSDKRETCSHCLGSGRDDRGRGSGFDSCHRCNGTGLKPAAPPPGGLVVNVPLPPGGPAAHLDAIDGAAHRPDLGGES